jgi:phage terminase large subunit GpA-like protein
VIGKPFLVDYHRLQIPEHPNRLVQVVCSLDVDVGFYLSDAKPFRVVGVHDKFRTARIDFLTMEWQSARSPEEENADRERRQFVWCLPVGPNKWKVAEIETSELACRSVHVPRGIVPDATKFFTAAMDLGKFLNHWIVIAWSDGPFGHIVDYGRIEVSSDDHGVEQASMIALRQFRDMIKQGWPIQSDSGTYKSPQLSLVDAGYMTDVVYAFCRESGNQFLPSIGRGASQQTKQWYNKPTQTGSTVRFLGEGYHINWLPSDQVHLFEIDADHWKTWTHQRLCTPIHNAGAITYFEASPQDHMALARHLTAEVKTEEFVAGKGILTKWERKRKQNHWFDALYNACAAGHYCGVRIVQEVRKEPRPARKPSTPNPTHRRQPWIDTERWRENQKRYFGNR